MSYYEITATIQIARQTLYDDEGLFDDSREETVRVLNRGKHPTRVMQEVDLLIADTYGKYATITDDRIKEVSKSNIDLDDYDYNLTRL
jgi:hypothetical protein